ncbi:MAG: glycosyltransferase [Verrucomicrobia bacterium]|nr:MAG: glycosyltransferase [Verrucomicrobiota bacterium]
MAATSISVVIRTLNAEAGLRELLPALHIAPDDELVVVDSGSTDRSIELARTAGARIVTIDAARFTYGRSLNVGFASARHAWVLALSSHVVPVRSDFLEVYRRAIARFPAGVVAAAGPLVRNDGERGMTGGITLYEGEDFLRGFEFGAGNPNCLYRRDAWAARPFDEEIGGGEDCDWYVREIAAGNTLAAVHAAEVYYRFRRAWSAYVYKGRIDHRIAHRYLDVHQPKLSGLAVRAAKLGLYALQGRVGWSDVKGSLGHCWGSYREAAILRKSGAPGGLLRQLLAERGQPSRGAGT